MLYSVHEAAYYATGPWRAAARVTRDFWGSALNPASESKLGRTMFAAADLFSNVTRRYGKPEWGIDTVQINGTAVRVRITTVWSSPW